MTQKKTFYLSSEIVDELESLSSTLEKDTSQILTEALNLYMDYHDLQVALEQTKDPQQQPLTHDEFFDGLDI